MKILRYKVGPEMPDWLVDYTWEKIVVPLYENNYITTLDPTSAKDFPTICYSYPDPPEHHHPRIVPKMIGTMLHEVMRQACRNKLDIPIEVVDSDMFIIIDEQTAMIEYMKNC
jgi:hypothetical protein